MTLVANQLELVSMPVTKDATVDTSVVKDTPVVIPEVEGTRDSVPATRESEVSMLGGKDTGSENELAYSSGNGAERMSVVSSESH